ncbi:ubiquinol-cytochrome c reductase iron-sulfur subunit [Dankookia sp. GCM10030260]|uniref:QcrA and Rieske domain-containing protein n=1 Tax=Dankookia sp. GCM10030260 TaxID=3273390 RepID=UPI0036196363
MALLGSAALAVGGLPAADAAAQAADAAARARPEPGDRLVLAAGENDTTPIRLSDVEVGGRPLLAWAMRPDNGMVRSGSRLNQILLVRLDPGEMDEATRKRSAEGVVAYSAICTHQQCPVSEWMPERNALHCPCHGSEFDPRHAGRVVGGPALRPLAALPVRVEGDLLVVGGRFIGRVGAPQPG